MARGITIVGLGALGSHLVLFSRNWKLPLRGIDFDVVENRNMLAQFHTRMTGRGNKAACLQKTMQGLFGVKIDAVPHKLTRDNVEALLGGSALVIDCTDNAEARYIIQAYVRDREIPCLHGALSASGDFARVVWDEHFVADPEGTAGQATCEDGGQLPFFALAASWLALAAQTFLDKGQKQSFQVMPSGVFRLA